MADEIKVTITGKDDASKAFVAVSKSADSMQKAISKDASAAGTSLTKMSRDAQTASATTTRSFDDMGRGFAVGAAAIGASMALFSQQIVSNQQNVATLTRTYGDAAGQLQAFAQQIQQSTTYSSEAAIQSANIFGTLARNYGVSVEQIQQLIQVSADLSATSGLTLEDTSQRVASAIRGEAEAAEALGLTMNQQAIDRDGLTLSMTQQEAATFRINALMEQSAFATGAAGDKADTTAGQIAQLNNKFQDMARGLLEAAGPLPEVIAGITNIGASSGLAIGGLAQLAAQMGKVSIAFKGMQGAEGAGAIGGLGSALGGGGLAASLGAVAAGALTVTAAFLPLIGTMAIAARIAAENKGEVDDNTKAIEQWAKAISDPALHEGWTMLAQDVRDFGSIEVIDTATGQTHNFTDALDELLALNTGDLAKLAETLAANGIAIGNLDVTNLEQLEIVYNAIMATYKDHATYVAAMNEVDQSHNQMISDMTEQYGSLAPAITETTSRFADLWLQVNLGKLATKEYTAAAEVAGDATGRMVEPVTGLGEAASRTAADVHSLTAEIEHLNKAAEIETGNAHTVERSFDALRPAVAAVTTEHEKFANSLAGGTDEMVAYTKQAFDAAKAVDLLSTNAQLFAAAGIKTPSLDVAVNLQGGSNAFDAVFGAIKQAQGMASQLGGAKSWADTLIGDPGTWAQIDQLLADSRISVEQYNAAQEAQISITRDNANAQQDLLAVQANLAPALADATHEQAVYIDSLQDMNATQQLAALGYMDTAESAKAMSLAQLAASSTTDTMQASTTLMIQQAAAADPVLKAMLEDMQLLDANTGEVNFDTNAADIGTAINNLTVSIDALIVAMGGIAPIHTESNAVATQGDIDNLTGSINDIPDLVSTTADLVDNVSWQLPGIRRMLDGLEGKTVTTYVDTIYRSVGVGPTAEARHGGVLGFANGGFVTASVAEVGAELARFANGGEALIRNPGIYNVPIGTNILPAPATKAEMRRRGGDDGIHIGVLNIYPTTADIGAEIRAGLVASSRAR